MVELVPVIARVVARGAVPRLDFSPADVLDHIYLICLRVQNNSSMRVEQDRISVRVDKHAVCRPFRVFVRLSFQDHSSAKGSRSGDALDRQLIQNAPNRMFSPLGGWAIRA